MLARFSPAPARRALLSGAAAFFTAIAWSQVPQPDDGNSGSEPAAPVSPAASSRNAAAERRHDVLEFNDGSMLHGSLEGFSADGKQIRWRIDGTSESLSFSAEEITQIAFTNAPMVANRGDATVKLSGGDWLTGEVSELSREHVQLKLGDGSTLPLDRTRVEWIHFGRNGAVECYDGPTSIAGFVTNGAWVYRDGALHATALAPLGRPFQTLPDRVEYSLDFDQGSAFTAFSLMLHSREASNRGFRPGNVQITFHSNQLQLWAQQNGAMKVEQTQLDPKARQSGLREQKPKRYRVFEDRPAGRVVVYIDEAKVADWKIDKIKPGENRGGIHLQPMFWNSNNAQSISRLRVLPWDGVLPENTSENPASDRVVLQSGDVKSGAINELQNGRLRLNTPAGAADLPLRDVALLRFHRRETAPEEDPPVAHVRLASGGEFDASAIQFAEGNLQLRTNFGRVLALPAASLQSLTFFRAPLVAPPGGDELVFKNGDRLRGWIHSAGNGEKIHWRTMSSKQAIAVDPARIAGVLLAARTPAESSSPQVVAQFRNGDLLQGEFSGLDKEQMVLTHAELGRMAIARERVRALYLSPDGKPEVFDGATDREGWMNGVTTRRTRTGLRLGQRKKPSPAPAPNPRATYWRYFDGGYTLKPGVVAGASPDGSALHLGRTFDALPDHVEFSFEVTSETAPISFAAQLFTSAEKPGYMMQFHGETAHLYDMSPRARRGGVFQQQYQFAEKLKSGQKQRRIRILAERTSGKMTLVVDGVVVGQFAQKGGTGPRELGRSIMLMPQINLRCTFSDLWIGPWDGELDSTRTATQQVGRIVLANGDEADGTLESATPEMATLVSEVGNIEVPTRRLTMVDFGGTVASSPEGAMRLRMAERGALTIRSYRIENEAVVCDTEIAGELKMPLSAVRELVLGAAPRGARNAGTR